MARLEVEIGGNASGLDQAASRATGILERLKVVAENLKIELFKASDVTTLNATGAALTTVTGKIRDYTTAAIQGSNAFKDQQTSAILDALNVKLNVLTGNAQIFGDTVKNQQAQVRAYEGALNKLLANGLDPLDAKVTSLKNNINNLNSVMSANSQQNLLGQFQATGQLIPDLENKIKRLKGALSSATDERSIVQYNIRLRAAQAELERLRTLGVTAGNSLTNSANSAAAAARKLSGGYNAVGLEFGRIIQDAPFAANNFGAIGNNITRLVEVLPSYIAQSREAILAQGGVASSANVAKASLAGLFTGFGGLTIAISALVAGYTFYQQYQQKVKREQDKLTGVTKEYAETLEGVSRAQLVGAKNAQTDLVNLKLLYGAYQNANIPLKERENAYKQIQQQYPAYFGNLAFEKTASEKTAAAYDLLTGSIIASAKARAAANIITKNSEKLLDNERKLITLREDFTKVSQDAAKAEERLQKLKNSDDAGTTGTAGVRSDAVRVAKSLRDNEKVAAQDLVKIKKEQRFLNSENLRLEKAATEQIAKGGNLIDLNKTKTKKAAKGPLDRSDAIVRASDKALALGGLEGVDRDVETVRQTYIKLYADLAANAKRSAEGRKTYEADLAQLQKNEAGEIGKIIVGEQQRIADEIKRIETESGIQSSQSRAKELAEVQKWYDTEVKKARDSQALIDAAGEGRLARLKAINEKYAKQEEDLQFKITQIRDKADSVLEDKNIKQTEQIRLEWEKRKKEVASYYELLIKLAESDPTLNTQQKANKVNALREAQASVNTSIDKASTREINIVLNKDLATDLRKVTSGFIGDLYTGFSTLNQQADQTFTAIVGSLGSKLSATLTGIVLDRLQKSLSDKLAKGIADGTKGVGKLLGVELQSAIAGLAIAGGLISGVTKKTSSAGQGIGGALSGAATGAALGTVVPGLGTAVGAVVGGIIGGIGGLFGAGNARKEEKRLMEEQLAEAKRQTDLLRQNALAYTSAIIGRMTSQGIITGVDVNGFGNLTAKVSGKDINFVLEREKQSRV